MATAKKTINPLTSDQQAAATSEKWVYVGKRAGNDGTLFQAWIPLDEAGNLIGERIDNEHWYKELEASVSPGAIFSVKVYRDGERTSVLGGTRQYCGFYGSEAGTPEYEKRTGWILKSRATETAVAMEKKKKKDMGDDPIKEQLAPLKAILDKQVGNNRRVMIALIMEYLTR